MLFNAILVHQTDLSFKVSLAVRRTQLFLIILTKYFKIKTQEENRDLCESVGLLALHDHFPNVEGVQQCEELPAVNQDLDFLKKGYF